MREYQQLSVLHLYVFFFSTNYEMVQTKFVFLWYSRRNKDILQGFKLTIVPIGRSLWPRGLRPGSTAVRLLGLQVRIPPRAWMSVCCECCVLSGRGLCVGLITHPEEA